MLNASAEVITASLSVHGEADSSAVLKISWRYRERHPCSIDDISGGHIAEGSRGEIGSWLSMYWPSP